MLRRLWSTAGVVTLLIGVAICVGNAADTLPGDESADLQEVKPQWSVGDRWVVETKTAPTQARRHIGDPDKGPAIQWQFTVEDIKQLGGKACYQVQIDCLLGGPRQPQTILWIDKEEMALRRIQTQFRVPSGFLWVTENYEFGDAQAAPVLAPLTALPVDLPVFQSQKQKSLGRHVYRVYSGAAETKSPGEIGFGYSVQQQATAVNENQVKSLIPGEFAKDLEAKKLVEVRLKTIEREVRQIWRVGSPWPVHTDNGSTTARLVKVFPATTESAN